MALTSADVNCMYACAGSNPKGIFSQVKDAVKLKPDIGFDMIAAVYVSRPTSRHACFQIYLFADPEQTLWFQEAADATA